MTLRLFGSEPASVFALLGADENSATFALGWVLEKSPTLLKLLVSDLIARSCIPGDNVMIDLQRHHEQGGFTDIEVLSKNVCHLILEAKRGWVVPGQAQLERYARRICDHSSAERRIVSLSAATQDYAARRLPRDVLGLPICHRSWSDMKRLVVDAQRSASSFEERLWLRHLSLHLEDYMSMQNPRDNMVYVVSLSADPIVAGANYSWIDVVEQDGRYFHPVGNSWPVLPPNYIGFRYRGVLQSVHHIDAHEVVANLAERNPMWPVTDTDHFVYTLGPAMRPAHPIRTGKIYRNGRLWCAIDTLISGACKTISDARDQTARRLQA